jgi:sugar/nucleoside kinase (ribokinase family)
MMDAGFAWKRLIVVLNYESQDEKKLREVLRFANAGGAITTTKRGAIPSLPAEDEVLKLIEGA